MQKSKPLVALLFLIAAPVLAEGPFQDRVGDITLRGQFVELQDPALDRDYLVAVGFTGASLSWSGIMDPGYLEFGLRTTRARDFQIDGKKLWFAGPVITINVIPKARWVPYVAVGWEFALGGDRYKLLASIEAGVRFFPSDRFSINAGLAASDFFGNGSVPNRNYNTASIGLSWLLGGSP